MHQKSLFWDLKCNFFWGGGEEDTASPHPLGSFGASTTRAAGASGRGAEALDHWVPSCFWKSGYGPGRARGPSTTAPSPLHLYEIPIELSSLMNLSVTMDQLLH